MGDRHTPLGQAVRARRQELGLTLQEASKATGVSRSHLNLIELGKATGVSRACVAKIDAGLDAQGALLALRVTNGTDIPPGMESMRRAEFNKAVVALGAALLFDPDRLVSSSTVDAALLHDLESLTADLAHRQHSAHPQAIVGPIRGHLQHLIDLGRGSMSPAMRSALARVTAETAAVAGWVVFRGHGDLVTAHAQLALGRQLAREAGDDVLTAQLLAASSSLYSSLDLPREDQPGGSPLALALLLAGKRKAGGGAGPLHGWLAARIAEEQALLGEGRKARVGLARAQATLPNCPPRDPGGLFCMWDETRFLGYAGKTLLILGDPAATELLEKALDVTAAPHPRLGLLVDLTMARVRDGNADEAVRLLLQAAELGIERGIDGFARWRVREGRAVLPSAKQRLFDEHLQTPA